jgi:hypothetical protein
LEDLDVQRATRLVQIDIQTLGRVDRRDSTVKGTPNRSEVLLELRILLEPMQERSDQLPAGTDVGGLPWRLRLSHRDPRVEVVGMPLAELGPETVEVRVTRSAGELKVRRHGVVETQRLVPWSTDFTEPSHDEVITTSLDPRGHLLERAVAIAASEELIAHRKRPGLRLDLDSDSVAETRDLRAERQVQVDFERELCSGLRQEPWKTRLRKAEGLGGIAPQRRFEGIRKSPLSHQAREEEERLQEIALPRGVRPKKDDEGGELDLHVEEGLEAADVDSSQHGGFLWKECLVLLHKRA